MKFIIHKNFINKTTKIKGIISDFNNSGVMFSDGARNKIKVFDLEGDKITVKSFKRPHIINQIVYRYFRKSKAKRSYEYANILISKNIGTPAPVAYVENTSVLGLKDSYYMCEQLKYDLTYRELISNPNYPDRINILHQFTKFTWKLHEQQIYFKDHSPGNTLIVKEGSNYTFYLVDLNRMSFYDLDFESRMKNFSRLTPKKEMVKIMSEAYAKLIDKPIEEVFEKMWFYTNEFQTKFQKKQELKRKYLK